MRKRIKADTTEEKKFENNKQAPSEGAFLLSYSCCYC